MDTLVRFSRGGAWINNVQGYNYNASASLLFHRNQHFPGIMSYLLNLESHNTSQHGSFNYDVTTREIGRTSSSMTRQCPCGSNLHGDRRFPAAIS